MLRVRVDPGTLPEPLLGSEPNSFAEDTVLRRLPEQVLRVIEDNQFSAEINQSLQAFHDDMPHGPIRPLRDRRDGWDACLKPLSGQNWLEAPWLPVEIYFYRRILEATDYFRNGIDPFALQKRLAWQESAETIEHITSTLTDTLDAPPETALPEWVAQALWGNQDDLGLFPVGTERPDTAVSARREATLADDTVRVVDYILSNGPLDRIDFILDNSGLEFVGDLCLADYLLSHQLVKQIVLHVKQHPYFVSDVMEVDLHATFRQLHDHANPGTTAMGKRLYKHLVKERFVIKQDAHWVLGLPQWEMNNALYQELATSQLLISKGDLNYRRWMDDRKWPFDTPFAQVVDYSPAPLLCLRTCKAPVASGISAEITKPLAAREPDWNTSGRYGVIQFFDKGRAS